MKSEHLINQGRTILDALKQINKFKKGPLVLFATDDNGHMVGTLTDGDVRRALVHHYSVNDSVESVMNRRFHYLQEGVSDDIEHLREQRQLSMKLVPVLDSENNIKSIIDLERYRSILPLDAVIMAGGKGIRLRPLTETTPKPLLKLGDKAIIDYSVDDLIDCGVNHISVTVNYLSEQIENHFNRSRKGVKISCVKEKEFLGTIGSIKLVKNFYNDTILVTNSDLFTNIDYESFFLHFKEHEADMSVAVVPYSVSIPYGIFELSGRNVIGIKEKPTYNYYANAGIYLIKERILGDIPDKSFFNATDLIELLISRKKKVIRFPISGYWVDIGKHEDYSKAQEIVKHL